MMFDLSEEQIITFAASFFYLWTAFIFYFGNRSKVNGFLSIIPHLLRARMKGQKIDDYVASRMILCGVISKDYFIYQAPQKYLLDIIGSKIMNNCIRAGMYKRGRLYFIIDKKGEWKASLQISRAGEIGQFEGKKNSLVSNHLKMAWDLWIPTQNFIKKPNPLSRETRIRKIIREARKRREYARLS